MADVGTDMFGRDSDSDSSEEAKDVGEAAVNTEENTAPTGGGAAGGFLGQVEKSVARPEGSTDTSINTGAQPSEQKGGGDEEEVAAAAGQPGQQQGRDKDGPCYGFWMVTDQSSQLRNPPVLRTVRRDGWQKRPRSVG